MRRLVFLALFIGTASCSDDSFQLGSGAPDTDYNVSEVGNETAADSSPDTNEEDTNEPVDSSVVDSGKDTSIVDTGKDTSVVDTGVDTAMPDTRIPGPTRGWTPCRTRRRRPTPRLPRIRRLPRTPRRPPTPRRRRTRCRAIRR